MVIVLLDCACVLIWLGPVLPGLNIGKGGISLQSLYCLQVGLPTWAWFGLLFTRAYLSFPQLLMSVFLSNKVPITKVQKACKKKRQYR